MNRLRRASVAPSDRRARREVVLVGGGHAHVQVLRRFAMEPPRNSRLTVILDVPVAVYSGMVPGFVAGQYRAEELEIDVVPLARRAGARVVLTPAVGVDASERRIEVEGRPPIRYHVASFDIGSSVAGLDLPGIREHAIASRPIGRFVERVDEIAARAAGGGRVVVVGGGAGGVELAFCLDQRLRAGGSRPAITLLQNKDRILPGSPDSLVRRVERRAESWGIEIRCGRRVEAAEPGAVQLDDGERLPCEALVWVTGAVSHPLFRRSGLSIESRGFVRVRPTLQVVGYDDLFAVGDCATLIDHPRTPKAGVYAVRQGPVLADNLLSRLDGRALRKYTPQSDFLALLNFGDGSAVGSKWGRSFEGRWVMGLKDRIDRSFMRRFQVLDGGGGLTEEFERLGSMADDGEMLCGGCAAKVGQSVLDRALRRLGKAPDDPSVVLGLDHPDDAAAWSDGPGRLVVSSIDAFRAFTDDPYLVGRVAAVNAVSDLHAKGAEPRYAQALVAVPEQAADEEREEALFQVLSGARAGFDRLGVSLIGGHTTTSPEFSVGFAVSGRPANDAPLMRLDGLEAGQSLILTKPLGTGVVLSADMHGEAPGRWLESALEMMLRSNRSAGRSAAAAGATGTTDVTGFGLAGHLGEMLRAAGLAAVVDLGALPALPGALELLARGHRSTSHAQNRRALRAIAVEVRERDPGPRLELLFDPQTAGGLLFGVDPARAEETLAALHQGGDPEAAVIGRVEERRQDGALIRVVAR